MASKYYILLPLCAFSSLYCVSCELDLSEDSSCVSNGVNGTCVDIFKCNLAALTYLYRNAGFKGNDLPEIPETCSYDNDRPAVCCTDCDAGAYSHETSAIAPMGMVTSKKGPVAWKKCLEYFSRLPYPCRGVGNFKITKVWKEEKQCHTYTYEQYLAVGGRDAMLWEFPHMALIGYGDNVTSADWLCGGTVISERFILTAAHCTSTRVLGSIKYAALGLLKRTDPKENWKVYNIKKIIIHPEYKSPSKYHDIALLETETEINFGKDLLPACLDVGRHKKYSAEASGWGRLGHKQNLADNLQVVLLGEFNEERCSELYPSHRHLKGGYDHQKQMCYGSNGQVVDTCEGDSGGPLQTNEYKCLYTVIGVTSYGKDCGIRNSAGMYTRVEHYVPWIESVVWPGEKPLE